MESKPTCMEQWTLHLSKGVSISSRDFVRNLKPPKTTNNPTIGQSMAMWCSSRGRNQIGL